MTDQPIGFQPADLMFPVEQPPLINLLGEAVASDPLGLAGQLEADELQSLPDESEYSRPQPELVHSGNYALYRTPGGLWHLTYQRTAGTNPETGQVTGIDNSPVVHCRDLPDRAAEMVGAVLDRDMELPPIIEAVVFGNGRRPGIRELTQMAKQAGQMLGMDDGPDNG